MEGTRRRAPEWFGGSRSDESSDPPQTTARPKISRRNRNKRSKVHPSTLVKGLALSPDSINTNFPNVQTMTCVGSPSSESSSLYQMRTMTHGVNDKRESPSDWTEEEHTSSVSRTCAPPSFISCQTIHTATTEPTFVGGYSDDEILTYSDDESTSPDSYKVSTQPQSHFPYGELPLTYACTSEELVFPELNDTSTVAECNPQYNILYETNEGLAATHKNDRNTSSLDQQPSYQSDSSLPRKHSHQPTSPNNSAFTAISNRPPRPSTPVISVTSMPNEQQLLMPKRRDDRKSKKSRYYTDMPDSSIKDLFGPSILDSNYSLADRGSMHDKAFGILFILHLLFVAFIAFRFGGLASMIASSKLPGAVVLESLTTVSSHDSSLSSTESYPISPDIYVDFRNAIYIALASVLYSSSLTFLTIGTMVILNRSFIQSSLCFAVVVCFAWGAVGIALHPYSFIPILGAIAVVLTIAYTVVVWDRIPLAAVNLNTSLAGLRKSMDLILFGCLMMITAVIWTIYWTFASLGLYDYILSYSKSLNGNVTFPEVSLCMCMILSYFWTINVILNTIQVVTSAVISTWWAHPERISFICSDVVVEAFQAVYLSFGSICYGSLILPNLQVIRVILTACQYSGRRNELIYTDSRNGDTDLKISEFQENVEAVNEFGFTVLGMSDAGFISAGKKSLSVFRALQWIDTAFDTLIPNVLLITTLFISFSAGFFALVVEEFDGYSFTNFRKPMSTAFLIGSWIGLVSSSTLLKLIGSAVRTVFICFAVSPVHLDQNHPSLSQNMRHAWGTLIVGDVV